MWLIFKAFLGRLSLTHLLVIGIISLAGFAMWAMGEIKFQKNEKLRQMDNFNNLRDIDSLKVAHLTFRTTQEMKDYIDSNKELSEMLEEQNIKVRKLQSIVYQKQTYIDNITRSTDVSGLINDIKKGISSSAKWKDSTECLILKGDVTYKNDSLKVNVSERKFDNTILVTGSWKRKPNNFFARLLGLGRKVYKVKATSKCGESETIVIDKIKK